MNQLKHTIITVLFLLPLTACGQANKPANLKSKLISQFERVGYSSLYIDEQNTYHVVFQESPEIGKPVFVYYAKSVDGGATWTKPFNLSNDGSGNGSGYPRLIGDKKGNVYAIWKRYGQNSSAYPIKEVGLDGGGGNVQGTLFYRVLNNGSWGNQQQISEAVGSQFSWFPTLHPNGNIVVMWSEVSPESLKNNWLMWYYADWIRVAALTPGGVAQRDTYSPPGKPEYAGGAPKKMGAFNLDGYIAADGKVHLVFERLDDKDQVLWYFNGQKYEIVYTYPRYNAVNTFMNPPKILYDEKGTDHIILRPASGVLESEQLWDIMPAQKKTDVIAEITKKGVKIGGFQASQGPGGKMAVVMQLSELVEATEAIGIFYEAGKWNYVGLTKNAAKSKFIYKEFNTLATRSYLSTLTQYSTIHTSTAYDKQGKPQLAMTLSADWMAGGYRVNNPSLLFVRP